MLFNSMNFLLFLVVTVVLYYILPERARKYLLLIASYYFYMQWNYKYVLLLLTITIITFYSGKFIEASSCLKVRKVYLFIGTAATLGILFWFKYFYFFVDCINAVKSFFHFRQFNYSAINIVLPVGISFFTLQGIGYILDVFRGEIRAERSIFNYALFISFFPQLVAGPIERANHIIEQFNEPHKFSAANIQEGIIYLLWGLYLKIVIADRIAIMVDDIFANISNNSLFVIIIGTVMFSFQIYTDFYGYSVMAKGAALLLGVRLMDNFNAPYFSRNVREFWGRWHISLSSWFRDYVYIPLGGSKNGRMKKYRNILVIFLLSGLWHGASITFVIWGGYHGLLRVCGDIKELIERKIDCCKSRGILKFVKNMVAHFSTILVVFIGWFFFRINEMGDFIELVSKNHNIGSFKVDGIFSHGLSEGQMVVLLCSISLVCVVDFFRYRGANPIESIMEKNFCVRCFCQIAIIFFILIFGVYGKAYDTNNFIYFQF